MGEGGGANKASPIGFNEPESQSQFRQSVGKYLKLQNLK